MATSWTLAAGEICTDALQHMGVIADGESASGSDMAVALRALDAVLKELPAYGYTWPKLSADVALAWAGVAAMDLPADYYNFPTAWKTVDGQKVQLTQIPHGVWVSKIDLAATGDVTHFYVSPSGKFTVWPTPAVDPVVTLQYQKLIDDAALGTSPDVLQLWLYPLGYGVADECALKFEVPERKRVEIAARWASKRDRALESSISYEQISVEVQE